ncbi:MAG TPA: metalloprotease PmbA [Gammaproteobacteria bacterium]
MDLPALRESLAALAAHAVELARRNGADQAEAGASHDEGLSVTVRMGDIESVERQRDRGLAVTVYRGKQKGSASTSDFSPASVEATVRKALSIASFTAPDEYAGLADARLMAVDPPDLELYFPWELDVDRAAELALRAESAARAYDPRIENSEGATVSTGGGHRAYANSHGFVGGYPTSSHSISVSVVAKDGSLERDYWYTVSREPEALETPEAVGEQAAKRALARLGARQIKTQTVPVIYPAELARGLFGHLVAAIRGTAQYRRASFLLGARGERIFPEFVDIEEDPHLRRALASAPFDGEGVATKRRDLVRRGVLEGYVLSSYSARRLGLETTGNAGGAHNLIVRPTAGPLEELIAGCDRAFVVGELLGQGVNIVTGDYSRGAAGFWVERGAIVHAVNEVTVAGNLREMFARIQAIGSDVDIRGGIRCGSVLIDALTVAGQ